GGIEALPGDEEEGRRLGLKHVPVASQHGDHPGRGGKEGLRDVGCRYCVLRHAGSPPATSSKVRCVTGARVRGNLPGSGASSDLRGPCRMLPLVWHPDKPPKQII